MRPNHRIVTCLRPSVSKIYTKQDHLEAIRAVARNYGISEELSSKGYDLLHTVQLINVKKSDVTCLGKCKNGGTCQRHIGKEYAVKGLLGVMRVVYDYAIQGTELEGCLEVKFAHLLCTQDHKTGIQARACVEGRIEAVEEFRAVHGFGEVQQYPVGGEDGVVQCTKVKLEGAPPAVDWKAAYEALATQYRQLEIQHKGVEQEVGCLQNAIKRLQKDKIELEKDNTKLQEKVTETKEDRAGLEVENCVLQMENQELKAKTESVRQTIGSLQLQLEGEKSDGGGYGTPRSTAGKTSGSRTPFDFTFHSGQKENIQTPPATPGRGLAPSSMPWTSEKESKQSIKIFAARTADKVPQSCSSPANSGGLSSSSSVWSQESRATNDVPYGFRVRPKSEQQ